MKRTMKRLSLLLALCLLLALIPAGAEDDELISAPVDAAVEEVESAKLWSEEIAKDVSQAESMLPEPPQEKAMTYTIGDDGLVYDGTVVIGYDANSDLTTAVVADGTTEIESLAFRNPFGRVDDAPARFTGLVIPGSVKRIGTEAFSGCEKLTNVTLGEGIERIDDSAFERCKGIESIELPESLSYLGMHAFNGCTSLTTVKLPRKPGFRMEIQAFGFCEKLQKVTIPGTIEEIPFSCFGACINLSDVTIEDGVAVIGEGAFNLCEHLDSIVIPDSVIEVNDSAFDAHTTICATCGSAAHSYAQQNGNAFVSTAHLAAADPAVPATCTETGLTEGSHCSACGEVLVAQEVVPKLIHIKRASSTAIANQTYSGGAIKPKVKLTYDGETLRKGTDYSVTYENNRKVGKATITITGKGRFGGTVKKTFRIVPRKVALSSLTAGKKKLTVKWEKTAGAGYQIQYGLKKDFAGAKSVTIAKSGTVKKVLKNLKSGKVYYVRIRGYKKVGGKKYVSKWSKALKKKVG